MTSERRYVFDTNTLVSALLLEGSVTYRAFERAFTEGTILVSAALLTELSDVLNRDKFDKYISLHERLQFLTALTKSSILIEPQESIRECRDPGDDMILELAVAGKATCIVSGDLDLLIMSPFRGIDILRPSEFPVLPVE